jgi:hypothetical protein
MTSFENQTTTNEIVPTHGTWTREDFCERCRSFDLLDLARGEPIPDCLRLFRHDASTRCPLCRFFSVPINDFPGGICWRTEISNQKHSSYVPFGALQAVSDIGAESGGEYEWECEWKYILPLSPGQKTEWPSSAAARRKKCFLPDERQPLPFRCSQLDKVDMNFLKTCIAGCRRFHSRHCAEPEPEVLSKIQTSPGSRLVDCITRRIVKPPGIVEYVALSYVWGEPLQQYSNRAKSLPQGTDELPPVLPKTLEDAITLTIQLGFQYLWVDKYCVNQSSPNELQTQLGLMNLIYYGAAITIIAAAGDDANSGLPGVGTRSDVAQSSIIIDGTTWVSGSLYTDEMIARSVWATRGWVCIYI